jgi:hypothetical protein
MADPAGKLQSEIKSSHRVLQAATVHDRQVA